MDKNANAINAKVKLTDVILKVRKVRVSQSVSVAHELALKRMPAIYPIRRVECKAFVVPGNIPSIRKDNIFTGTIPKSFVFFSWMLRLSMEVMEKIRIISKIIM